MTPLEEQLAVIERAVAAIRALNTPTNPPEPPTVPARRGHAALWASFVPDPADAAAWASVGVDGLVHCTNDGKIGDIGHLLDAGWQVWCGRYLSPRLWQQDALELGAWARDAKAAGYTGLAFDGEPYDGGDPAWTWRHATTPQAPTRADAAARVRARATEVADALVRGWGGRPEVLDYYSATHTPGLLAAQTFYKPWDLGEYVIVDWLDGLAPHVDLVLADSAHYKDPAVGDWVTATGRGMTAFTQTAAARGWPAATRVTPMCWFDTDGGLTAWGARRPVEQVRAQLTACAAAARLEGAPLVLYLYGSSAAEQPAEYMAALADALK
jgi:hypothetical protein